MRSPSQDADSLSLSLSLSLSPPPPPSLPPPPLSPDSAYLAEPGRLFKLAKKHTWMLTAPPHLLPPALLLQLLKNLLFLSLSLHANPRLAVVAVCNHDIVPR